MNGINLILIILVVETNKQNQRLIDFVESRINDSTVFHIPPISLKQVVRTFPIIKPKDLMESELNPELISRPFIYSQIHVIIIKVT